MSLQGISAAYAPLDVRRQGQRDEGADGQTSFAQFLAVSGTPAGTTLTSTSPTANPAEVAAHAAIAASAPAPATAAVDKPKEKSPVELFLEYMQKTPEQRWREAWLKQHKLTEEEFAALPPEKQQALTQQMQEDMKKQTEQTAQKKAVDKSLI
ncbi:MAG: hypothetical protein K2Q01_04490 [Rickettsiales bacterium]|nr:hypothetical protein [Rickettsiales bacterium]